MWVLLDNKKIEYKTITYVQGLFKIFDEIIVNAADTFHWDSKTTKIDV